ncbi:MAG TPA: family 78 glycoside hydrolase catalytic domain [Verrucomicrobia bacterium]|nr:family 78 glycoside hydrolase catalytic domain [Verrucomicrobiota bacterium]HOP97380.1 glycoside hydrolase family 78 protein [Verrucomicrobiota bacterium]
MNTRPRPRAAALALLFCCCSCLLPAASALAVDVVNLECEHSRNPIGIGNRTPRLSWQLRSDRNGEIQTAYQVQAASDPALLERRNPRPDLWDSGKVVSDQSVLVPWAGKPQDSRAQVFWRVRVWDRDDRASNWSQTARFELGLLDAQRDWKAQWVTADLPRHDILSETLSNAFWISADSAANQAAAVRYQLVLPEDAKVRRAVVHAAADGLLTIYANGTATHQGSSSRTAPLFADITEALKPGTNVIAIGSAAVRTAIRRDRTERGRNAIAAHGLVELENGARIKFDTGDGWKAAVAPAGDWFAAGFDVTAWTNAILHGRYAEHPSRYSDNTVGPGRYLRKAFRAKPDIVRARLYATALGVYEVFVNGERVNQDSILDPGWTDYAHRVMAQTYDVTRLIRRGDNAVAAVVADGWYAGRVGWMGLAQYGTVPAFAAQLEITYRDGSMQTIVTDESWRAGAGEIIGSDMQWGEIIDARKRVEGWNRAGFDDSHWANAVIQTQQAAVVPQAGPPVRRILEVRPVKITPRGASWLVDFGQNLVGFVRVSARGKAGAVITVRHAEMLSPDGSLYTVNLRPALSTDTFILSGRGRETFEPHFTFHGFRYAEISGYPGRLSEDDIRAIVVSSDTPRTGWWESSNPELNRLYENIVWSQRGNFLSVPTDCPQRDERMGWLGDALVFAPTAARNANVAGFFMKWLTDVNDAQGPQGEFPTVAPRANQNNSWPVWGDAGVIIPWAMYRAYGDKAFLANSYTNMARWVDYSRGNSKNLIRTGGVGDHLAPQRTPVDVVATAYFANSARIVADSAALLGYDEDAGKYDALHRDIARAFNEAFVSTNGVVRGDTQTAYILALEFNLLPEHLRPEAARRLAENVETAGHLTTGFIGVGLLCPALTAIGRADLAWKLVLTDSYPSWLFSVKNGATTIWERWDGWTPERGFQDPAMNSFNHYSFGAVGEWLFGGAAGIQPDNAQPGYKHSYLRPQFTSQIEWVKATQHSPYGEIRSHWRAQGEEIVYDVTIPPNSSATMELPVPPEVVRASGREQILSEPGRTRVKLGSGSYRFAFPRSAL